MADLDFRTLGASGPLVSTVGIGGNNFGRPDTATEGQEGTNAIFREALDLGVTLIDTAELYGREFGLSETLIGTALRGHRDEFVIATKFGHAEAPNDLVPGAAPGSRAYIRAAIDASLRRLQTDRVDLYQQHTPDPTTPIADTIAALDELVADGKILSYGHSNFTADQIDAAADAGGRFVSAQNLYNLLDRGVEREVLPATVRAGLGFLPYWPLANGLFTGKFTRSDWPEDTRIMRQRRSIVEDAPWDEIEHFERWAADRGVTMLAATFGWLLAQPALTSVIAGVTRPEQLRQNAKASVAWTPTADEVGEIGEMFPLAG
jgi:aryl-alcohol dehydrogenase-like predicted oxidoreductase